jgi:hypothetical protein
LSQFSDLERVERVEWKWCSGSEYSHALKVFTNKREVSLVPALTINQPHNATTLGQCSRKLQ